MNGENGLILSRTWKPLIHYLLRQHSRTPLLMVDVPIVPCRSTSLVLHHTISQYPAEYSMMISKPDNTPLSSLITSSLSNPSKGLCSHGEKSLSSDHSKQGRQHWHYMANIMADSKFLSLHFPPPGHLSNPCGERLV